MTPAGTAVLRQAHAERERLRIAGQEIPFGILVLDSQYQEGRRKARPRRSRPRPAGLLAGIRSDAARAGHDRAA